MDNLSRHFNAKALQEDASCILLLWDKTGVFPTTESALVSAIDVDIRALDSEDDMFSRMRDSFFQRRGLGATKWACERYGQSSLSR